MSVIHFNQVLYIRQRNFLTFYKNKNTKITSFLSQYNKSALISLSYIIYFYHFHISYIVYLAFKKRIE
jgi:hypothetical protein